MTLEIGKKAPAFKGQTAEGPVSLNSLKGSNIVLYFYPKDDTPGCTMEACAFRDTLPRFKKMNARVFGVSKDSLAKHEKFAKKYELPFPLISDEDGSICESFGVLVEKSMYVRKYMWIERATYLIDKTGIIRNIWRKVKVPGHAEDVLKSIKNL